MKKRIILGCLLLVVFAGALTVGLTLGLHRSRNPNANDKVTLVTTPEQEGFETHPDFMMTLPEVDYGENLAAGKDITEDGHTQVYFCKKAVDESTVTYWEGKENAFPNQVTIDMGEKTAMTGARILLNPRAIWGARTQEIEVQISDDGETFTTVFEKAPLDFDPLSGNFVYMSFLGTVEGQYVRFVFYSNTGATGGQAAEIEIYG